ncbi:unnamed protein product, partial [Ectocarpus sp. 12 AP-2014]
SAHQKHLPSPRSPKLLSEAQKPRQKPTLRRYTPPPAYYVGRAQQASLAYYDSIYLGITKCISSLRSQQAGLTYVRALTASIWAPPHYISGLRAQLACYYSTYLGTTDYHRTRLQPACTTKPIWAYHRAHHVRNKPAS